MVLLSTWAGTEYAWGSAAIISLGIGALVALVAFCLVEMRAAEPLIPLWLFKNRTFSAASGVGFIVGFAMFGAIIYLPLYLQIVHGASPTASGLQLLPMIAGMLVTFIVSGRIVTRTGRYKVFPITGSAVLGAGLFLLSLLGPQTPYGLVALYMLVTGLGVGLVMQVLVVAVQNSVPYTQLGVATATSTFFRTIGGAFGVAVLGAVFTNRLLAQLRLHATAAELKLLSGSNITANPEQIDHLPPAQRTLFVDAFSHAIHSLFLVAVPFVAVAFVLSWVMKEIPLRTTANVPGSGPDADPDGGDAPDGDAVAVTDGAGAGERHANGSAGAGPAGDEAVLEPPRRA
jgi:MFS family permease